MIVVHHRRNHAKDLAAVPVEDGVEIDVRSYGKDLIIQHDPFLQGELLSDWLEQYKHQLLILNTKEEGIEQRCLELMNNFNIENFFFLDQTFPLLIKTAILGEKRCAARVSEYESIETAISLNAMVDWIWIDTFTRFPLNAEELRKLSGIGYKLCVVSPELLGRDGKQEIKKMRSYFNSEGLSIDAVCTDLPDCWR